MLNRKLRDANIISSNPLSSPEAIANEIPVSEALAERVIEHRLAIEAILEHRDKRMMVIVGPCSIHHHQAGIEFAQRLKKLSDRVADKFMIIMRAYFEKPRTTLGWKGMIYDPHLDGSNDIESGIRMARQMLHEIVRIGLPVATEILEPIVPQYVADLVAWAAIGARTAESQPHRQMASGLSMPVGIKNATDGSLNSAIDAIHTARAPHAFIGINRQGHVAVCNTRGNPFAHIVLRGGKNGPNYTSEYIEFTKAFLKKRQLPTPIVVDCSHANSDKDPLRQPRVFKDVIEQRMSGEENLVGVMMESNLLEGRQDIPENLCNVIPGLSITDACLGWEKTEAAILHAYNTFQMKK